MSKVPTFTYILRRWNAAEDCFTEVVVIQSVKQLTPDEVKKALQNTTHHPAAEFEEVHQEPDTSIVLDPWDDGIENCKPVDMDFPAVKIYRNWWMPEVLTPTAKY